jgi:hypothetical protein
MSDPTYHKSPLYSYYNNHTSERNHHGINYEPPYVEDDPNKDSVHSAWFPHGISYETYSHRYGKVSADRNIENTKRDSTTSPGRIAFASIFALMFLACNHLSALIMVPFFILLFVSTKNRTFLFITLSLPMIAINAWSFVVIPIFGLLYTTNKKYLAPVLVAFAVFWIIVSLYGNIIANTPIFMSG